MPFIDVGRENSGAIELYYEDHGVGKPVVLIHGWPLSGRSWERQVPPLLESGHRVITYDRRGFGKSSQPTTGYEYETLAADLNQLMTKLDLSDATLVGFSMGGGEVARYIGAYGTARLRKAVFISAVPPFLLKTADNPTGVDARVFEPVKKGLAADRAAYLRRWVADFYNLDVLRGERVSDEVVQLSWQTAAEASPKGTFDCVSAWTTDFRRDLLRVDVPTLIIHGDADRILPLSATGKPLNEAIKGSRLVTIEGGPHGLTWTHADIVNRELAAFLAR